MRGRYVAIAMLAVAGSAAAAGAATPTATWTPTPTPTMTPTQTLTPTPIHTAPLAFVPNSSDGTVSVIDTSTDTAFQTITVGSGPQGVAVAPGGGSLFVANSFDGTVSVISTPDNTVVTTIPVGAVPLAVAVNPTGTRVYVANSSGSTLSVISTAALAVVDTIPIGGEPYAVVAIPSGDKVYVTNQSLTQVSVVGTATNTVIGTIAAGNGAYNGIAVNPAGTRLYVTNSGLNNVSVIDTVSDTVVDTVAVGAGPIGIAVHPDGSRVYVSNDTDNTVSIIHVSDDSVTTVSVGSGPYGLSLLPDGSRVYVANAGSNDVSVISTASETELHRVSVGNTPVGLGQFMRSGIPSTAVGVATASGTISYGFDFGFQVSGILTLDPTVRSVFGTPVDLYTVTGGSMSLGGMVTSATPFGTSPGFATTVDASSPSFSFTSQGILRCSPLGCFVPGMLIDGLTTDLTGTMGTALPDGVSYLLQAVVAYDPSFLPLGVVYNGSFELIALLPGNTPAGTNVVVPATTTVDLCPLGTLLEVPFDVTYSSVTVGGSTFVSATCAAPGSIPANVQLDVGTLHLFFDVSTDASYTAPVTICLHYPDTNNDGFVDAGGVDASTLRIFHEEQGAFTPRTILPVDIAHHQVCAQVDSLSPFLLATEGVPKGFLPPDHDTGKCEDKITKKVAKLAKARIKCHRKVAAAALSGGIFDGAACKVDASAKFDDAASQLTGCPACLTGNLTAIRTATESIADSLNGGVYCAGTTALPSPALGFVPPDSDSAKCEHSIGKALAKLTKALFKCEQKSADAAAAGNPFDLSGCHAAAATAYGTGTAALTGCPACATSNAAGLGGQIEPFVVNVLSDVYCAGTTALP